MSHDTQENRVSIKAKVGNWKKAADLSESESKPERLRKSRRVNCFEEDCSLHRAFINVCSLTATSLCCPRHWLIHHWCTQLWEETSVLLQNGVNAVSTLFHCRKSHINTLWCECNKVVICTDSCGERKEITRQVTFIEHSVRYYASWENVNLRSWFFRQGLAQVSITRTLTTHDYWTGRQSMFWIWRPLPR